MECRMSLGPVMQGTSIQDQICNLTLCENCMNKSDKMPISILRFSLTTNDLGEFLDILETCNMLYNPSLKCILIFLLELGEKFP